MAWMAVPAPLANPDGTVHPDPKDQPALTAVPDQSALKANRAVVLHLRTAGTTADGLSPIRTAPCKTADSAAKTHHLE